MDDNQTEEKSMLNVGLMNLDTNDNRIRVVHISKKNLNVKGMSLLFNVDYHSL